MEMYRGVTLEMWMVFMTGEWMEDVDDLDGN